MPGSRRVVSIWHIVVIAAALTISACSSNLPIPSSTSSLPTAPTVSLSPTPSLDVASLSPIHRAFLTIVGEGSLDCAEAFYGGCVASLLLRPAATVPWPTPAPGQWPPDMQFATERTKLSKAIVLGPTSGAPTRLDPGRWQIAIARVISSDAGTCNSPCTSPYFPTFQYILCSTDFEVLPTTDHVDVRAHFGDECAIDVAQTMTIKN